MNDLQHEFIRQSVADLHSLAEKSRRYENENLPENLLREIFRVLHTIKGTSQVFGLPASSDLAHALENLLAAAKSGNASAEDLKLLAPEGVEILAGTLAEKDFQIPASFAEKVRRFQAESSAANQANNYSSELPAEFFETLSAQEKSAIKQVLAGGKDLFILEIGFEATEFAAEFKDFRAALAEKGEIIALLPSAKFAAQNGIGFQIVYATVESAETIVKNSPAKIIYQKRTITSNDLPGILAQIEAHGKTVARRLGKSVEFEIFAAAETLPAPILKIVFDALAHLVRNAVGHAFDHAGKITIEVKAARNNLILKVADNGKGLDAEKIRRRAIEKNLISGDENLSTSELKNLIFAPGFTTADEISDVSGRGVGLDAVKTEAENAGGEISVKSETGAGTTFEIFLPLDIEMRRRRDAEQENGTNKI